MSEVKAQLLEERLVGKIVISCRYFYPKKLAWLYVFCVYIIIVFEFSFVRRTYTMKTQLFAPFMYIIYL